MQQSDCDEHGDLDRGRHQDGTDKCGCACQVERFLAADHISEPALSQGANSQPEVEEGIDGSQDIGTVVAGRVEVEVFVESWLTDAGDEDGKAKAIGITTPGHHQGDEDVVVCQFGHVERGD